MMILILHLLVGFICGGFTFAMFQRKYKYIRHSYYYDDVVFFLFVVIMGFLSIVSTLFLCTGKNYRGFLLPFTKKSKIEADLL